MPRKRPQLSRQSATAKRLRLMRSKKTEDEQRQSAQTRRSESTCPPLLGQDPTRRMEPARTEGDAGKTEPFEAVFVTVKTELPDEDDAGTWVACSAANAAVKEEQATHAGHGNSSAYRHLEEDETQHAKALGLDRELTPRSGCSLKPAWLQAWSLGLEKKHQEERVPASHETLGSPAANTTTTEKCFACSLCYAKFAREDHLSIHMRTHSSEKLFPCLICSAKFRVRSFLNDHVKTHTSAKLFSCSTCSAQFNVKSYLNEHIKTHAGEKLFACSECSAKFTTLIGLNVHMRTHTG
ncbi:oocyte zinc finger protein XlCOF8.4-like isoform X3 [Bacillus rossius redtenbacheri]